MKVEIDSFIIPELLVYLANKAKGEPTQKFAKIYIETIENLCKTILEECANNQ